MFDQQTFGRFMFNAGIRFDYHSAYGAEWIPQVGISYMPGDNTTIKASASKGFRMPNSVSSTCTRPPIPNSSRKRPGAMT